MKRLLEKELLIWKERKEHLPLLLRGARQVGKSYLIENFGKDHFEDVIVVDFERHGHLKSCFQTREPSEIIQKIEVALQKKIVAGKSLLFLDEIQLCPEALVSLRYFKELMPELHVIAAGSLLEFLLNDTEYSFPVGRVEFLYLRPLSFKEFLMAAAPIAFERLNSIHLSSPLSQMEHEELLKWVRRYLFVGGMPAAVKDYLSQNSFLETQRIHHAILKAYESDFGKYGTHTQHKYLQMVFQRSPSLVGQTIKYTNIDRETRSRDLKPALELLTHAGLILQVFATTASGLPLHAHIRDRNFKLLFLDVGLLQTAVQADAQEFWENDILQINSGMLAEQYVGQELIASDKPYQNRPLLYWEKEEGGKAEVDFVITVDSKIIPIEVKSGSTGSIRSLHSFISSKNSILGVRISQHPLSLHEKILSIPLYLAHDISRFVFEAIDILKQSGS